MAEWPLPSRCANKIDADCIVSINVCKNSCFCCNNALVGSLFRYIGGYMKVKGIESEIRISDIIQSHWSLSAEQMYVSTLFTFYLTVYI